MYKVLKTSSAQTHLKKPSLKDQPHKYWPIIKHEMEKSQLAKARRTQVLAAIQFIRSKQFDSPIQFLEKFQDLVTTLTSMSSNPPLDDDLINYLRVASSDDEAFLGQVQITAAVWEASNPGTDPTFDAAFDTYMKAATNKVISIESNSSNARSVNRATRSFRPRTSNSRSDVRSNRFIDWTVNHTAIDNISDDDYDYDDASDADSNELLDVSVNAATRRRRRNPDPSVTIPSDAFKEMSPAFRSQ